jgi:hypothetical protein
MVKNNIDWKYSCRTHEFITAKKYNNRYQGEIREGTINKIRISDIGDGGCKSDKFERDERLLKLDIEDPEGEDDEEKEFIRVRAHFYLGQTYECLSRYEDSILYYGKRAELGGWPQEVFMSKYKIGKNYEAWGKKLHDCIWILNHIAGGNEIKPYQLEHLEKWNPDKLTISQLENKENEFYDLAMRYYGEAHEFMPYRAEAIYAHAKLCRERSYHKKCYDLCQIGMKIPKPIGSILFSEHAVYNYLFKYELSIVCWYLAQQGAENWTKERGQELFEQGERYVEELLNDPNITKEDKKSVKKNAKFYI